MEVLYGIIQGILVFIAIYALVWIFDWIFSVNARIQSYSERIWGFAGLLSLVVSVAVFWMSAQAILPKDQGSVIGLVCLILSYVFYEFWQSALHEESS